VQRKEIDVIEGVSKVVIDVEDQDRALAFWTEKLGFRLVQDTPYGEERWLEVGTPDAAVVLVLNLRRGDRPSAMPEMLPTSNVFFYCNDLARTYEELRARGVEFPQPPVEQDFGWWSMFRDEEGNRFALRPREAKGKEKDVLDSGLAQGRLAAIAGRWDTSGHVIGDRRLPVEGTDTYEVLAGGHFLIHHVDVTVGEQKVRAIEIIGEPDPQSDAYLARSFDSEGNFEVMKLRIDEDGTFHFSGGGDIAPAAQSGNGRTVQVRSTLTVSQDRASMKALWERSEDGINWEPWMDMTFTRSDGR
jgi:predicted enzyme related to lactoylglutathione lyase